MSCVGAGGSGRGELGAIKGTGVMARDERGMQGAGSGMGAGSRALGITPGGSSAAGC